MCTVPLQTDSCFFFLWSLSLFASLSWTLQILARRALICLICKQRTQWMITRYANTWVWFCTRLGTVENVYDFVSVMRGDGEAYYIYIYTMRTCARSLAHSFTHSHCCLVCSCCRWKNICIIHWFSSGYLHIVAMQSCCQRKLNRPIFTRYYFWIHSINSLLIVTKLALDFEFEYRTKKYDWYQWEWVYYLYQIGYWLTKLHFVISLFFGIEFIHFFHCKWNCYHTLAQCLAIFFVLHWKACQSRLDTFASTTCKM